VNRLRLQRIHPEYRVLDRRHPIEYSIGTFSYILNDVGSIVTNITTSLQYLQYVNLFINYFLRRIKDKQVSRKGLALKKIGNLIRECKSGNIS
jgi:hypothetical protein